MTQCETFQLMIFESPANEVDQQKLNRHLDTCADCAALLEQSWELQALASRWQEAEVPRWSRRRLFFGDRQWFPMVQVAGTFASLAVLVLVVVQVQFSPTGVTQAELDQQLAALRIAQDQRFDRMTTQQVASNQLVLRTMLESTRQERREDLSTLLVMLSESEAQRTERTAAGLRYLLANQLEDRQEIQQIGQVLKRVSTEGGTM